MSYDECIHALTQFYGNGRPSVESKNMLRNFKKNYSETIEEYTTRIMSFADGCRLDPETKKMYMHMAFMNGISYDPAMQRYIEKHTQEQPVVRIVDLKIKSIDAETQITTPQLGPTATTHTS